MNPASDACRSRTARRPSSGVRTSRSAGDRALPARVARHSRNLDAERCNRYSANSGAVSWPRLLAGTGALMIPMDLVPVTILALIVGIFGTYMKLTDRDKR